jgi:uncharacterized protein
VDRLLVQRGARVDKLWHAAALGLTARLDSFFAGPAQPPPNEVNDAFWQARHGRKRRTAEYLLAHGADLNWIPDCAKQSPPDVAAAPDTGREALVSWLREKGAASAGDPR